MGAEVVGTITIQYRLSTFSVNTKHWIGYT